MIQGRVSKRRRIILLQWLELNRPRLREGMNRESVDIEAQAYVPDSAALGALGDG